MLMKKVYNDGRAARLTVDAKDVFNVDKTGLLLPGKTMAFRGDVCSGGKKSYCPSEG